MGARVNGEKRKQHTAHHLPLPNRKHRKHNNYSGSISSRRFLAAEMLDGAGNLALKARGNCVPLSERYGTA